MHRALAKVIEVKKIKERKEGNFTISSLKCKIKVKGPASKGFKLPANINGKVGFITRECPDVWKIKAGDEIILDPSEIKTMIPKKKNDINQDGYEEKVLENSFLKAIILPHLGARVGSLIYKTTGKDIFKPTLKYGKKEYVDFGGTIDLIEEDFPGNLWNAEFKEKNNRYEYEKKGLKIEKEMKLLPSLPILQQTITITTKKKKEINYWQSIPVRVCSYEDAVFVPTMEKLEHKLYYKPILAPWTPNLEYYVLKLGAFLLTNKAQNFLFITNPDLLDVLNVKFTLSNIHLFPKMFPKELKKGESIKYSCLYGIGDKYYVDSDTIAICSRARNLFSIITVSTKEIKTANLHWDKEERKISLSPRNINLVGRIWTGETLLDVPPEAGIHFKL